MGRKEKLVERLLLVPKNFTWKELQLVLSHYGYKELSAGKGVKFICQRTGVTINLHPPHPGNEVKRCYLKMVIEHLREQGKI